MKLTNVRVTDYQSVRDSTEFDIGDVTCLVGKNESGKTALLQAIYRLRPIVAEDAGYSVTDDYPRRDRNLPTTLRHSSIEFSEHLLSVGPPEAG